jgi:hypothetical protein
MAGKPVSKYVVMAPAAGGEWVPTEYRFDHRQPALEWLALQGMTGHTVTPHPVDEATYAEWMRAQQQRADSARH